MGGLASCFNSDVNTEAPKKNKNNNNNNNNNNNGIKQQPANSRVTDSDKAILEVKARLRKLKTYVDKLNIDVEKQQAKVSEQLKVKNKQRALIALKHKKYLEKELDKAMGAQAMLQQTISNIESAQMDVNVFEAMKQGDQVLSDLQKQASLEDFEELYEKHQEHQAIQDRERELFGQVLDNDELQDELDKLDALIFEEKMPDAVVGRVGERDIQQYQEKHGIQAESEQHDEVVANQRPERQLQYA